MLRVLNAKVLVTIVNNKEKFLAGADQDKVATIQDGGLVVGEDGNIAFVGTTEEVKAKCEAEGWTKFGSEIDATGKCILPGFVDGHSHPVWAGNRCHEFKMKLAGASYLDIHKMEGGIAFTAKCTKEASEGELCQLVAGRVDRMLKMGTTTAEAKSGYGFDTETELKELRVIHKANEMCSTTLVSTFLGAHSVPPGMDSTAATKLVIEEMLPAVMEEKKKGLNSVTAIDVFCEKGVYNRDETRDILAAGKKEGLLMNFHGDELNPLQSGELAGELGADAVSHLEHVSEEGIKAMSLKPTFATLLPSTAYVLRITPPPARKLIDGNVPIALGSDFCPNAHSLSIPYTMNLACVLMKMTMNEALVASTLNSAASLGIADKCGSLEVGKWGDLLVVDAPHWEHMIYEMVDPPLESVYKKGKKAWAKDC